MSGDYTNNTIGCSLTCNNKYMQCIEEKYVINLLRKILDTSYSNRLKHEAIIYHFWVQRDPV